MNECLVHVRCAMCSGRVTTPQTKTREDEDEDERRESSARVLDR